MEQILLAYGLPKETVTLIIMLYKNMKIKVCTPDGKTDFFDTVVGVLQGNTLAPISVHNLPRLHALNVNDKRKWLYTKKASYRNYYADDIVLLANTPIQAESLPHSLEQAAGGSSLHVNADKTVHVF